MRKFGTGFAVAALAAVVGIVGAGPRSSIAAPGDAGRVRVELDESLSSTKRANFDRMGGREAVARALSGVAARNPTLAGCGDALQVTVTDYRLSKIPWAATGRAARPYRSVSTPPDSIRAVVMVSEPGSRVATIDVQASADGAKTTRTSARLDRLAERLAKEVAVAVERDLANWC